MTHSNLLRARVSCPCCGFPTLTERAAYEICELCNWEDDGQGDLTADEVRGGPNSDYSLSEARKNFPRYRVMYHPDRDQRITAGDSPLEYMTKGQLMAVFNRLHNASLQDVPALEAEIRRLEDILDGETDRQVTEYEASKRRDA